MKGLFGKILIVLGILLILAAILWWAIAVGALVKFPTDLDITAKYEGKVTMYMDPVEKKPLPSPMEFPLKVERNIKVIGSESTSNKAVVKETVTNMLETPQGQQKSVEENQYVIDRKNMKNIQDNMSWAFEEGIVVDRSGTYYVNLPFDTSKDETYPIWKNEIGGSYDITKYTDKEEEEFEGLKLYNFEGNIDNANVADFYKEVLKKEGNPMETNFNQLKATLKAKGVDVDPLIAALMPVMTPEDLANLQAATGQPIKLNYKYSLSIKASIEPKTGSMVNLWEAKDTLAYEVDMTGLIGLMGLISKYQTNPQVTAEWKKIEPKITQMQSAPPEKIYEVNYKQTEDSVKDMAQEVKDIIGKLNFAKVYIPWIFLIVGAVILIGGLLMGGAPAVPAEVGEEKEAGKEPEKEE